MASVAGYGALSGLGQGIAMVGQNMLRDDDAAQRQQLMQERQMALLEARLAAKGAGAGGGGQPNGNLSFEQLQQIAADPNMRGALRMVGGLSPVEIADTAAMEAGRPPTVTLQQGGTVQRAPGAAAARAADYGDTSNTVQVPTVEGLKYTPGDQEGLRVRATQALRRALGLMNPGHAKAIAEAEGEEQQNAYARNAATDGNPGAIRGALLTAGKEVFSPQGTDLTTGAAANGSIGEAERAKDFAHASYYGRQASEDAPKKIQSSYVDAQGNRTILFKDGTRTVLGKDKTYQSMVQREADALAKSVHGLGKSRDEIERIAKGRIEQRAIAAASGNEPESVFTESPNEPTRPPAPARLPQAPLDAAAREVGKTYETPRGPLVWMGNGWKPAQGAAPTAAPALKALPPGAKQIGTSGGKPVYETPDGKRFIQG